MPPKSFTMPQKHYEVEAKSSAYELSRGIQSPNQSGDGSGDNGGDDGEW